MLLVMFTYSQPYMRSACVLSHKVCEQLFVCTEMSSTRVFKASHVPYLVHGVLGDDLDCPQGSPQVHEHDRYRPQSYDCQDAHKWVDPNSSSFNAQLKHTHTDSKIAKSTKKSISESVNRTKVSWDTVYTLYLRFI